MSIYLDTSVIVAALTLEAKTEHAQNWIEAQPAGSLFVSTWTHVEVLSALSIKVRSKQIGTADRAAAAAAWEKTAGESFLIFDVEPRHFYAAARLAGEPANKLRAGDALHLALASLEHLSLATFDRALASAASASGVALTAI